LNIKKISDAIEVLKLNTQLFPESWNVYDSYGEALLKSGRKTEAVAMYNKSVELNPGNENGKRVLEQIRKDGNK
jgi:Flp pilus assembly protein TadD